MDKKLSICIVAYKGYEEVINAIASIEQHTSKVVSKRIFIVDNSSTERNVDRRQLEIEISKYDDVSYFDIGENLGFGKGHNYVLPLLDSDYHAIVNPDILLKYETFLPILTYMNENPDVGMVIPNITDEFGVRQAVYRKELTISDILIRIFCKKLFRKRDLDHTLQYKDYTKPFQVPFGQGSFLVIRTDLFRELGGFDEGFFMYLEDADLCKRVNDVSKLMYIPDATVIHKWKQGSHKSIRLLIYHLRSIKYYFQKWGIRWI